MSPDTDNEPGEVRIRAVGRVESSLRDRADAPKQGDEGSPDAWLVFEPEFRDALQGLTVGDRLIVLTWLDRADRETLVAHPRGDETRAPKGIFTTRSPGRPNPIGLHTVEVLEIEDLRILVSDLEALDGTPVLDVKGVLAPPGNR